MPEPLARLLALKWKDCRDVTATVHKNKIVTLADLDRKIGENTSKPLCVLE